MNRNRNGNGSNKTRKFGLSRKKKNTYVLHMSNILLSPLNDMYCPTTPMLVLQKNGATCKEENISFEQIASFPTPAILHMIDTYHLTRPVMGKLASTVVEYLDKLTGEPVLMLFPHTDTPLLLKNFNSLTEAITRLNHASLRDLVYQMHRRNILLSKIKKSRKR